jgi:putative inorganic carbon (hco3(-)) transporter
MDFALFLLLNAVLFLRPEELFPAIAGMQIYYWVILANLIITAPAILNHLQVDITKKPVTVCVLGVFVAYLLSHATKLDLWSTRVLGLEFGKVILYYLLLVSVVNSFRRLVTLLAAVALLTVALNAIAVLNYHGYIQIEALQVLMQGDYNPLTGERFETPRMRATSIFTDPNDLSMIIVGSITILLGGVFHKPFGGMRFLLAAPIGFLVYALLCTQSRGGLLALGVSLLAFTYLYWGPKVTAVVAALAAPAALALKGRQADIAGALSGGTGESRVELWSAGLQAFKSSPVFGIGAQNYAEECGQVAHNSFVHAFTELGLVGGSMYLGVFLALFLGLWDLHKHRHSLSAGQRTVLVTLFAFLAAYCVSMLSLSRNYIAPTYLAAGMGASFLLLVPAPPAAKVVFNGQLVQRLGLASVMFIAGTYMFVRLFS